MNDPVLLWGALLDQATAMVVDLALSLVTGFALFLGLAFVATATASTAAELGWSWKPG